MPELPAHLRRLETLTGALDIIRYLDKLPEGMADMDDIAYDLDMSSRSTGKATRRLVTNGYIQMRSDYVYELTKLGRESAATLAEYDAADDDDPQGTIREVLIAVPRNLVAGQTSPLIVGLPPTEDFPTTDLVLRLDLTYAELGAFNEMVAVDDSAFVVESTIAPQGHTQARIRLEVLEMLNDGDDIARRGGMYVDVTVLEEGDTGEMIAYSTELIFD